MGIFKAYDIRGVVPDQLRPDDARRIGNAAARFLLGDPPRGKGPIGVGWDARESSPALRDALLEGIASAGADAVTLGAVATPILYYAVDHHGLAGGVMVTASHNPAQYNGFKICGPNAVPIGEASGLRDIERLAGAPAPPAGAGDGARCEVDPVAGYVDHLLALAGQPAPLSVAIDCGNGMAAIGLVPLLERLPLVTERLYFEPDCSFPNHPADPLKVENLADVAAAVRAGRCDFGVAFDGDADRAGFVDEKGEPVPSDLVTALLARALLRRHPGARVLYDLRSSRATAEAIEADGGVAEMSRVGHSFIKAQMRESGAVFAGELSGHFYFRFSDTLVADDGLAAFLALVDVLSQENKPLSELIAPLRRYPRSGEISRPVADPPAFLAAIEAEHAGATEISHLDGLLVRYPDWWFNLRASNTEPVVRLNLEADSEARMERERDRLLARMAAAS
jgi:phosphomannomutase